MDQRGNHKTYQENFDLNENKHTKCQTLWKAAKAVLREKFIAFDVCIRKEERFQIIISDSTLGNYKKK